MDTPYTLTPDGHELQFQTNYLSPWLFTNRILPAVLRSQSRRVVMVSSVGHHYGGLNLHDVTFKEGYTPQLA